MTHSTPPPCSRVMDRAALRASSSVSVGMPVIVASSSAFALSIQNRSFRIAQYLPVGIDDRACARIIAPMQHRPKVADADTRRKRAAEAQDRVGACEHADLARHADHIVA